MRALKILIVSLSGFFAIFYLLFLSYAYFNQESMIFFPPKLDKNYKFNYSVSFEEMKIASPDGKKLSGLLFKSKHPKGLIFYLHGNSGALDTWGEMAQRYTDLGYDIFILDYRGFGKSEGKIESQQQFSDDVSAAYKKLMQRYNENCIVIIGYSIGTGPAAQLASQNNPAALILQAPYYSLREFADTRVPFIPNFLKKYTFETHDFIPKVKAPVYIFHGNQDQVIGYENSVRLSKLLKPPGKFFTLEAQDHNGVNDNADYLSELKMILDSISKKNKTTI